MFIDTRTYVILKDELLLTFFYQLLWLFYPFYWSCLIVCSSGFVWWFMRLLFSSLRSSCCNIHLLNKFILLFSSFFLFVHCFNCLLPLSAAVSGSSLRLFQCLVLYEFSLPLFALSIRSIILFSFSFVCLFRKFYSRYNDFVSIYNIPLGGMLTDFFILIVRP